MITGAVGSSMARLTRITARSVDRAHRPGPDADNSKKRLRGCAPELGSGACESEGGTAGEPVDGVRGGAGGRACALRAARGRGRAGLEVRAAGDGVRRARPGGPDPAARADRRALGLVHRPGAGEGERPAGRGGVHVGDGGGELPPGRHRGRRVRRSRCCCSPPTGRRSCAAPAPARPSTRSSCTVPRSAGTPSPASPSGSRAWPATGVRWPAAPGRTRPATSAPCPARST